MCSGLTKKYLSNPESKFRCAKCTGSVHLQVPFIYFTCSRESIFTLFKRLSLAKKREVISAVFHCSNRGCSVLRMVRGSEKP